MNATRIEPRVHCHKRPLHGGYVNAAATTPNYLREVFEAERARIEAARPGRRRRRLAAPKNQQPTQLLLVV
ncbi:MAG TPA: hypothetical protein VMA55_18470 [Acidovorax sp.]|nr:hypothetical protein [Acidovorax sp.]